MSNLKQGGTLLLLALLGIPCHLHAANAPYEIDIKELDKQKAPVPPKHEKKPAQAKKRHAAKAAKESAGEYVHYTVRPGDHIFKILMVRFGMSNDEAERLIPEISRINGIHDLRKLQVGQTLLIPAKGTHAKRGKAAKKQEEQAEEMLKAASSHEQGAKPAPRAPAPAPAAPAPSLPSLPSLPSPPVPATAAAPAPPAAAAPAWLCAVPEHEPATVIDSVLNALAISWSKNRIIRSEEGAAAPYSIRVDRYFEYKGERYIVSFSETDPYNYTLIRILESAGYRALMLAGDEDFRTVAEKLLKLIGAPTDFGRYPWQGGKDTTGFLLQPEEAAGRRVIITDEKVDPRQKWVMKPGCLAK